MVEPHPINVRANANNVDVVLIDVLKNVMRRRVGRLGFEYDLDLDEGASQTLVPQAWLGKKKLKSGNPILISF